MYIYRCSFVSFSFNTNDKIKKIKRTCKKKSLLCRFKMKSENEMKRLHSICFKNVFECYVYFMCLNVVYTL